MVVIDPVTLGEAQFLTGRSEKEINRAIDRGVIDKITEVVRVPAVKRARAKRPARKAGKARNTTQRVYDYAPPPTVQRTIRKLGGPELLFFVIEREMHEDLTPAGRKKLYETIKARPDNETVLNFGPFETNVKATIRTLAQRYKDLKTLRSGVVQQTNGEPFLKGTDISVYRVGALAEGQSIDEILADYPSLTAAQVRCAIDYSIAYPKVGRPYPARSFKRSVVALAEAGAFDFDNGGSAGN